MQFNGNTQKVTIMETSLRNLAVVIINRINQIRVYHNTRDVSYWAKEIDICKKELSEMQRILVYLENQKGAKHD